MTRQKNSSSPDVSSAKQPDLSPQPQHAQPTQTPSLVPGALGAPALPLRPQDVVQLQRTIGNQAVQRHVIQRTPQGGNRSTISVTPATRPVLQRHLDLKKTWGESVGYWGGDAEALQKDFQTLKDKIQALQARLEQAPGVRLSRGLEEFVTFVTDSEARKQIPWEERATLHEHVRQWLEQLPGLERELERELFANGMGERARSDLGTVAEQGLVSEMDPGFRQTLGQTLEGGSEQGAMIQEHFLGKFVDERLGKNVSGELQTLNEQGLVKGVDTTFKQGVEGRLLDRELGQDVQQYSLSQGVAFSSGQTQGQELSDLGGLQPVTGMGEESKGQIGESVGGRGDVREMVRSQLERAKELEDVGEFHAVTGMGEETKRQIGESVGGRGDVRETVRSRSERSRELETLDSSHSVTGMGEESKGQIGESVGGRGDVRETVRSRLERSQELEALGGLHSVTTLEPSVKGGLEKNLEERTTVGPKETPNESDLSKSFKTSRFVSGVGERARSDLGEIEGAKQVSDRTQEETEPLTKLFTQQGEANQRYAALVKRGKKIAPKPNKEYIDAQLAKYSALSPEQRIASLQDADIDGGIANIEFDMGQAETFLQRLKQVEKSFLALQEQSPKLSTFFKTEAKKWAKLSWAERQESLTNPEIAGGLLYLEEVIAQAQDLLPKLAEVEKGVGSLVEEKAQAYFQEQVEALKQKPWSEQGEAIPRLHRDYLKSQEYPTRMDAIESGIGAIQGTTPQQTKQLQENIQKWVQDNRALPWAEQVKGFSSSYGKPGLAFLEERLVQYNQAFAQAEAEKQQKALEAQQQKEAEKQAKLLQEEQAANTDANGDPITKTDVTSLTGTNESKAVQEVLDALSGGEMTNWVKAHPSRKWGDMHRNRDGYLPGVKNAGGYKEYYVEKDPGDGTFHGSRRVVTRNGKPHVYYTWTHYGDNGNPPFVRIK